MEEKIRHWPIPFDSFTDVKPGEHREILALAMQRLGFDTSDMVIDVFNAKSDELSCSIKYPTRGASEEGLLSCDCYSGCWGTHSAAWPIIPPEWKLPRSEIKSALAQWKIPYGGYVFWQDDLRIHPSYFHLVTPYCIDGSCPTCRSGEPCH